MPKVSVIIPCYGVEKYLGRCMDSVLKQTLSDIEIILVDDGSKDKVPEMCDEYARQDDRIKVIHKANGGLGYARNSGLEIATGEYVAFVDSDDYVDLSIYETLYYEAEKENADAVFCGFNLEGVNDNWIKSNEIDSAKIFQGKDITRFMLDMVANAPDESNERRYYMSVWRAIYRRSIIINNNISFLSERQVVSEDIPFQVDFLKLTKKLVYIPDNLYYYCNNGSSLTATYKKEKYERFKYLRNVLLEKLKYIDGATIRCDRLFIGYTRYQLHHLMLSSESNKIELIRCIVNDPIWCEIEKNYPIDNFKRMDLRLMYWMILHKHSRMLVVNSYIVNNLRKILSRR